MAAKKRPRTFKRNDKYVRRKPRARKGSKGARGILSNPYVASQAGAFIGAALATIHQEDPNAFSRAFDAALPPLVSAGREYERRDVIAVLTGKRKKGLKLKELVTLITSGGHVTPLDLKEVKRQLGAQLQFYTSMLKNEGLYAEPTKPTKPKKGSRS